MRLMISGCSRSTLRIARIAVLLVIVAAVGAVTLVGCSRSDERAGAREEAAPMDEQTAEAARTRGIARAGDEPEEEPVPQVVLSEMSYEWRTSPEKGLAVVMEFTNPADTYERARGYVFLVAEYQVNGSTVERGVYPWNTRIVEGLPDDYREGTHLLYRDTQTVRAFIPYERADGYYNILRVHVYHEDGRLITNRMYELDITGTPGEKGSFRPGFDL
jgi:hypothetical protein